MNFKAVRLSNREPMDVKHTDLGRFEGGQFYETFEFDGKRVMIVFTNDPVSKDPNLDRLKNAAFHLKAHDLDLSEIKCPT